MAGTHNLGVDIQRGLGHCNDVIFDVGSISKSEEAADFKEEGNARQARYGFTDIEG
jgi:hypothetical protein